MSDAVAAALAALNQRLKALTDAIKEVNETLGKGGTNDAGDIEGSEPH